MAQGYNTSVNAVPSTFAYERRLLDRLVNSFYHVGYGEEKKLEANMGPSITFRRMTNLSAATTALTEGVTPPGSSLSNADISATVYQYGDFVTYSDWVDMVGVDANVVKIIDDLQSDQVADTFDQLCRNMLVAGTVVRRADAAETTGVGGATRAAVNEKIEDNDLDYAINYLERRNVKHIKERVKPGVQISTQGLLPTYIGITHPDNRKHIEALDGFVSIANYPAGAEVVPGEIGTVKQVRIICTANAKVFPSEGAAIGSDGYRSTDGVSNDVYTTIIFGKGAYGNVRLNGGALKHIVKPLGYKDPLNQEGSVGWKGSWGGLILDQNRVVRIESCCSKL